MRRLLVTLLAALGAMTWAAGVGPLGQPATAAITTGVAIDPLLQRALAASAPTSSLTVIAVFRDGPTAADRAAIAATGAAIVPYTTLPMAAVQATPAQVSALSAVADVKSLWLNHSLELALHETTREIGSDVVNATPSAGGLGITGAGVGVAVLDSGIDGTHPDLHYPEHTVENVKVLGDQHVFSGLTLTQEHVPDTDTTAGHGTHVAGIIAGDGTASHGYYTGVAPGADLVGVGAADGTDMLTALAGYDWILTHRTDHNIRVINNSWADDTSPYNPDDPLNQASLAAYNAGINVVFAAGNDGPGSSNVNTAPAGYNIYAWPSWVIGVAAEDKLGVWANYSSVGDASHHPIITAPGSWVASARALTGVLTDANSTPLDATDPANPRVVSVENDPYYTVTEGTSMAAPHVSGTVALMLQANPTLTPDQVKAALITSARPMSAQQCPLGTVACGAGALDALNAVRTAMSQRNQPPVAALAASPVSGAAPLTVTLDASASTDPDGQVASYRWDFEGTGMTDAVTTGPMFTHVYAAGVHHPMVTAVDGTGLASAPAPGPEITVANPPHAAANVAAHGKSGQPVTFDASGSTQPQPGTISSYRFTFGDGTSATSSSPVTAHTYVVSRPTLMAWTVTVTNSAGVSAAVDGTTKITP